MTHPLFTHEVTIRESHLDVFGHMNNAAYLVLFEEARWEFITRNGYGLEEVKKYHKGPVVLQLDMKFRKEILLREKIRITVEPLESRGKLSHFRQEMLKADGTVAAELELTFGLFDLQTRKLIEPTPEWKQAIRLP